MSLAALRVFRLVSTDMLQESGLEGESSGSATSQNAKPKIGPLQVCAMLPADTLPMQLSAIAHDCVCQMISIWCKMLCCTSWSYLMLSSPVQEPQCSYACRRMGMWMVMLHTVASLHLSSRAGTPLAQMDWGELAGAARIMLVTG